MTWLLTFIAKSALMQSPFGAFLKRVPKQVWIALAIVAVVVAAVIWHQHKAHAALKAADAAGYARAMHDIEAKAVAIKKKADALNAKIAQLERSKNDAENTRINRTADALSLHGPGKAHCERVGYPSVPAAASRPQPTSGTGSPSAASVPPADGGDEWTAVRWGWLVATGRQCDLNRTEALSWRNWREAIAKNWPGK